MKALTLHQPWASLVAAGAKPFEFRGWRPPVAMIGQRIAIHAAARKIKPADISDLVVASSYRDQGAAYLALGGLDAVKAKPIIEAARYRRLPVSCVVCTAILGAPMNGVEAVESLGAVVANRSEVIGWANWAWPLTAIEPVPNIPARGRQGFWKWEPPA